MGLLALPATSSVAASPQPASLMVEYTFDAVNTSTVADLTGRGHVLTLSGSWSIADGVSTPAVAFAPVSLGDSPSRTDLNPGSSEFAYTTVFRLPADTSALPDTPNMFQKGFYGDVGQWKMQLKPNPGLIMCRIKGTLSAKLLSSSVVNVDDGAWHTATCWRTSTAVGVTVDGVTDQVSANVGDVANGRSLRVGAKSLTATTDQFPGIIDYASMAVGSGAAAASRANAPVIP